MTRKAWKKFAQNDKQSTVILATSSFATWLGDDSFIASCLPLLTTPIAKSKKPRKPARVQEEETFREVEMDVLCACVDGISPHVNRMPYVVGHHAGEGFSILQGRTRDILPDLWMSEGSNTAKSPTMTATLTFTKPREADKAHIRTILPLANTLFSNGKHSTLLVSKWRANKGSFLKVASLEKSNQEIHAFDVPTEVPPPSISVPATPLTPARRIVSGLGNIVKQIDLVDEGCRPASHELEANIDEYLAQTRMEKSTIAVWALIVPSNLPKPPPEFELMTRPSEIKTQWRGIHPNPDFIGHWMRQGAKLCRVLSGGGGWGIKQGLLSLDPQTTFSTVSEARFDFSTGSLKDQRELALGNIAEVGAFIQFFVATPAVPAATLSTIPYRDAWRRTTVIGTVPSTIDDQLLEDTSPSKRDNSVYIPGHFGAVSESGIFLSTLPKEEAESSGDKDIIIHTKIDLPYSYVYRDMIEERNLLSRGSTKDALRE